MKLTRTNSYAQASEKHMKQTLTHQCSAIRNVTQTQNEKSMNRKFLREMSSNVSRNK
jgi:hypothetical protein